MGNLSDFLGVYSNKSTRVNYRVALMAYMDFIYGKQRSGRNVKPEEIEKYETLLGKYLAEDRDLVNDLMKFNAYNSKSPPCTAKLYFTVVKEFFAFRGIEFNKQDLKRIRNKLPKGSARTIERDLDHETLASILTHMDIKGRSFFLTLASSGMRIGELCSLDITDFDFTPTPAVVNIRGEYTKTGDARFTFISKEATDAIREWLKVRDKYIQAARFKNLPFVQLNMAKERPVDDSRMYPFTIFNARDVWIHALKKAGFYSVDPVTNRIQIHAHMLRKFFRSQLALACPVDIVEMLMGHRGYLTDAYRRFTKKQMGEYYLKAEHLVTIQVPKELKEMESEFRTRMNTHSEIIENVVRENIHLKNEITEIRKTQQEIEVGLKSLKARPEYAKIEKAVREEKERI